MKFTQLFLIAMGTILAILIDSSAYAAKTFVYCSEGSPSSFNPQMASDGPSYTAGAHQIYNTLVDFKRGTTELAPGLAESWTTSKDGMTVTFKLRKGVKFHSNNEFKPARDFNAEDVLFSFFRQMKKDHPYNKVSGGSYEYFEGMEMGKIIKDIKKIDDHTVQFLLSRREAPFFANLAMPFASILSAEYGDAMMKAKTPEKVDTNPIGTGPFVFMSYQKDTMIRYKANENYFEGRPKVDNLVIAITTDPSVRYQKLKTGECNMIAEPSPADLEAMKTNPKLQVLEKEGLNVGYLAMNITKGPFKKLEVRQAVNYALNRKAYIDAIYLKRASVAKNPIPPTLWSYNESTKDFEYNPEKAKELLAKAGFPNGFEVQMYTLPVSRPYNPAGKKMGELMQADLAKVGIKVKLVSYDWPTYLEKAKNGEHEMLQIGWTGDNGDPDNFLNMLLGCASVTSGSNYARWCYKPFNDLVQEAKQTLDVKKRADLYKKAQGIFKDQVPWVTLAHAKVFKAMEARVTGYQISPFGDERFDTVDLK